MLAHFSAGLTISLGVFVLFLVGLLNQKKR